MSDTDVNVPEWERLLTSAARLQRILPDAILVGGTAAALYADHRISRDTDHVLMDLRERFDEVLAQLESVAGWKTARIKKPVLILGSLDGIETGVRQLIRSEPLETTVVERYGQSLTVPTEAEILRIKAVLILKRNATRDYVDFAALGSRMSARSRLRALEPFDRLYPQPNGQSALQQLLAQISAPMPHDLEPEKPERHHDPFSEPFGWERVKNTCSRLAQELFRDVPALLEGPSAGEDMLRPPSPFD